MNLDSIQVRTPSKKMFLNFIQSLIVPQQNLLNKTWNLLLFSKIFCGTNLDVLK